MTAFSNWATLTIQALNQRGVKVPNTPQNQLFLASWQAAEGNGGTNNPLNTTLGGYPSTGTVPNTPGVENYASPQAGAQATAATIAGYPAITTALQSGNPFQPQYAGGIASSFATWSGHGSNTSALSGSYKAIVGAVSSGNPTSALSNPFSASTGASLNAAGGLPVSTPQSVTGTTTNALSGLSSALGIPSASSLEEYLVRGAQILAGFVLLFAGLFLLARQVGLAPSASDVPGPVGAVAGAVG